MNALIILAHPSRDSFNHAIARAAADAFRGFGCRVILHDLYAEQFDPLLPADEIPKDVALPPLIESHCRDVREADAIVVVHPNWWGMPPAILTGWVDRVMRAGLAYRFLENDSGEGVPVGLLQARAAIVFNTANTPEAREREAFGDPLENIWKRCVFDLCGVKTVHRRTFSTVVDSTLDQRQEWLAEVARLCQQVFPPNPPAP